MHHEHYPGCGHQLEHEQVLCMAEQVGQLCCTGQCLHPEHQTWRAQFEEAELARLAEQSIESISSTATTEKKKKKDNKETIRTIARTITGKSSLIAQTVRLLP